MLLKGARTTWSMQISHMELYRQQTGRILIVKRSRRSRQDNTLFKPKGRRLNNPQPASQIKLTSLSWRGSMLCRTAVLCTASQRLGCDADSLRIVYFRHITPFYLKVNLTEHAHTNDLPARLPSRNWLRLLITFNLINHLYFWHAEVPLVSSTMPSLSPAGNTD